MCFICKEAVLIGNKKVQPCGIHAVLHPEKRR